MELNSHMSNYERTGRADSLLCRRRRILLPIVSLSHGARADRTSASKG